MHDTTLTEILDIYVDAALSDDGQRCCVAPSPEVIGRLREALNAANDGLPAGVSAVLDTGPNDKVGFNDGLNRPGDELPFGAPSRVARNFALERAQLSGRIRVIVVLVDFEDQVFADPDGARARFETLFFSKGVLPTGSVNDYFREVTSGAVDMVGEVVGPYRMPRSLRRYANGASGTGRQTPNARTMARDAALAANPHVNFTPYDNDGDGYVEAFIVVHAGRGAEETVRKSDIWSHKWVLSGGAQQVDGAQVYAYLTIPEDARLGVCAHELGHLVFGFPDLYDTSNRSEGVGNWCLMGGGSWLGSGDTPAHPSAWCKAKHGWADVNNVNQDGSFDLDDVKTGREVLRLWRRGVQSKEYFLVENRQRAGFDSQLPGEGLLIWRIDDSIDGNSNPDHPQVALVQADGHDHLRELGNRGDAGDVWPGSGEATQWDATTTPNSLSYGGLDTEVAISNIQTAGGKVSADCRVGVRSTAVRTARPRRSTRATPGRPSATRGRNGGRDNGREGLEP